MTKEELAMVLPEPFNYFVRNGSIDYRCINGGDHEYLKKLGYEPKLNSDCTYICENIPWFQFSCYGWGTMFDNTTDEGRQIFHDMWVAGFISLWRGRTYTFDGNPVDYNADTNKFTMYDRQTNDWVEINNPFVKRNQLA